MDPFQIPHFESKFQNQSSYKFAGPISDDLIWTKFIQPNKSGTKRTHFRLTNVILSLLAKQATTH